VLDRSSYIIPVKILHGKVGGMQYADAGPYPATCAIGLKIVIAYGRPKRE
jgi:hypothetical protein